jgi:hypothetical protein
MPTLKSGTDLGHGHYRVTGIVLAGRSGVPSVKRNGTEYGTAFLCKLSPDSSDKLRGFKVKRLMVGRPQPEFHRADWAHLTEAEKRQTGAWNSTRTRWASHRDGHA